MIKEYFMKNQEETINGAQGLEREAAKLDNEANKLEHQAEEIQNEARKLEHEAEELKEEAEKLEHESHEHEHKHHDMVKITINGTDYEIQRGRHTVLELKTLAHIATADKLNQIIGGKLIPLPNDGIVDINGGEIFASNVPSGGSSWR
jgi:predicted  nucleic acid-binding Zn-ribbon protein